jgi:hypothetical protein
MAVGVATRPAGPWGADQRLVLALGWVLGVGTVALGWWGASGEAVVANQIPWLAVGALGVMIAGALNTAWLLAGRRAVGVRCRDSIAAPEGDEIPVTVDLRAVAGVDDAAGVSLVAGRRMRYFHRSGCPLARGKAVTAAERNEHVKQGRKPCEVCRP